VNEHKHEEAKVTGKKINVNGTEAYESYFIACKK
jgi:hypothetical protein